MHKHANGNMPADASALGFGSCY